MLVFMGGFGVWAQVWSKGSCVGKVVVAGSIPAISSNMLLLLQELFYVVGNIVFAGIYSRVKHDFRPYQKTSLCDSIGHTCRANV